MRSCSENELCASLPDETRRKLCARCRTRLSKAGSLSMYEAFDREVSVILDGAICGTTYVDEQEIGKAAELPYFALSLPGRPLSLDVTFSRDASIVEDRYGLSSVLCLTDCHIASFEHGFFFELFETDQTFAQQIVQAGIRLMTDISQFAAIMRAGSVYAKVGLLMQKLLDFRIYLSRQDIAMLLACNRVSVSSAFTRIQKEQPEFYAAYVANKNRPVDYYRG